MKPVFTNLFGLIVILFFVNNVKTSEANSIGFEKRSPIPKPPGGGHPPRPRPHPPKTGKRGPPVAATMRRSIEPSLNGDQIRMVKRQYRRPVKRSVDQNEPVLIKRHHPFGGMGHGPMGMPPPMMGPPGGGAPPEKRNLNQDDNFEVIIGKHRHHPIIIEEEEEDEFIPSAATANDCEEDEFEQNEDVHEPVFIKRFHPMLPMGQMPPMGGPQKRSFDQGEMKMIKRQPSPFPPMGMPPMGHMPPMGGPPAGSVPEKRSSNEQD